MQVDTSAVPVEQFTIRIDAGAGTPRLVMEWGTFRWSVPVSLVRPALSESNGFALAAV
jgi:hypothetical protein